MKILHVTAPSRVGGLERVVVSLATGLKSAGEDVRVAAILDPDSGEHPLVRTLESCAVPVSVIRVPARHYGRERSAVAAVCATHGTEVMHTHGYHPDVVDGRVARRLGIPLVSTVHGFTGGDWRNRFYEWLQIRAYRHFDALLAVSEPISERLARAGVPRNRIHLVPNAWSAPPGAQPLDRVAARDALGVQRGGVRVGWVGRLSAEKGPDLMLDALRRLWRTDVLLSMVGEGPMRTRLEAQAHSAGVAGQVTWHGLVTDAGRLLAAFDVLVLSSRTEGTPIILFEAIAAGVPVVVTAVGGVPAVVTEREGVVVPSEDAALLARGIARALDDRAGARARASAAAERVAFKFAAGPWIDRQRALYRTLGGGRQ